VDQILGVGGTGTVFAAHHLQLDTGVAIKFLRPSLLTNPDAVASFVREARATLQMHNEHVARVFDVGTLATGAPYMVMEFLDGADLGKVLQNRGPLSVEEAVDFVLQACEGLAEAHALGIVHRDLKPTNLFCIRRPDGRPIIKVLDFGICEVMGLGLRTSPDKEDSDAAALSGSPLYMSPEQINAPESVDVRTDIWALGVILFELLSNRTPFAGDTLPEVYTGITSGLPQPLAELTPHVPLGLIAVIETCLEKDPRKRYPNVADLGLALLPFGHKRARISVDRISDILQAAVMAADVAAQSAPAGLEIMSEPAAATPPSPSLLVAPPNPPFNPASDPSFAAPSAKRPARRALAVAGVLLLVGAGVATTAFELLSRPRIVGIHDVASTSPVSSVVAVGPGQPSIPTVVPPRTDDNPTAAPAVAPSFMTSPPPFTSRLEPLVPPDRGSGRQRARMTKPVPTFPRVGWSSPPSLSPPRPSPPRSSSSRMGAVATVATAPTTASGTSAGSQVGCNPTFDLDDQGRKHFKAECLTGRNDTPSLMARAAATCDPTFELDDQGRKHFKPECFLNAKR
jgi:serine/threonine protein kinase